MKFPFVLRLPAFALVLAGLLATASEQGQVPPKLPSDLTGAPAAPTSFRIVVSSGSDGQPNPSEIELKWEYSGPALTRFEVEEKKSDAAWQKIAVAPSLRSLKRAGLLANRHHYYRVSSVLETSAGSVVSIPASVLMHEVPFHSIFERRSISYGKSKSYFAIPDDLSSALVKPFYLKKVTNYGDIATRRETADPGTRKRQTDFTEDYRDESDLTGSVSTSSTSYGRSKSNYVEHSESTWYMNQDNGDGYFGVDSGHSLSQRTFVPGAGGAIWAGNDFAPESGVNAHSGSLYYRRKTNHYTGGERINISTYDLIRAPADPEWTGTLVEEETGLPTRTTNLTELSLPLDGLGHMPIFAPVNYFLFHEDLEGELLSASSGTNGAAYLCTDGLMEFTGPFTTDAFFPLFLEDLPDYPKEWDGEDTSSHFPLPSFRARRLGAFALAAGEEGISLTATTYRWRGNPTAPAPCRWNMVRYAPDSDPLHLPAGPPFPQAAQALREEEWPEGATLLGGEKGMEFNPATGSLLTHAPGGGRHPLQARDGTYVLARAPELTLRDPLHPWGFDPAEKKRGAVLLARSSPWQTGFTPVLCQIPGATYTLSWEGEHFLVRDHLGQVLTSPVTITEAAGADSYSVESKKNSKGEDLAVMGNVLTVTLAARDAYGNSLGEDKARVGYLLLPVEMNSNKADTTKIFGKGYGEIPADTNPVYFNKANPPDPTLSKSHEPALVVFYKDVIDSSFRVQPFTVNLSFGGLAGVQWTRTNGPASSGNLQGVSSANPQFVNPNAGGLYQFDGTMGSTTVRTSLILPLAGAEIKDVVASDITKADAFATAVVAKYGILKRNLPTNGLRWFVTAGAGDYLGRPDNAGSKTSARFNPVDDVGGMGAVATWFGVPVRNSKASNFLVGYASKKIGVFSISAWLSQGIGTRNDASAIASFYFGWDLASGTKTYSTDTAAMLQANFYNADVKNTRLWPNNAAADNHVSGSSISNYNTQFISPGFTEMTNP